MRGFLASACSHTFLISRPSVDELLSVLVMIEQYRISVLVGELNDMKDSMEVNETEMTKIYH
jgi:hypothetical protein